ncbi:MFS transporter [Gordonia sp. CPCC 205515]|uniref:MFS transporter n=1 Tax=Gordonia sp. CPCC 205515 TaxID=3140791 RepID=UPI003AF36B02
MTDAKRMIILATCCLSLLIVGIDSTGLNVALPSIAADLGASTSQLQWVIDAYTLVLASLLMLGGSLGDRLGRKRIFLTGLTVFALASIGASLATSPEMLIGARMVQAVGGSMLNPVAMAIVTNTFTDPAARARAIGMWGAAFGLSMALGPVVGGALVHGLGWESIFWLNVPICAIAILLTLRYVPESRAERQRRPDPAAQVLLFVFLATLTFGIIEGNELGWGSVVTLGSFVIGVVAFVAFLLVESRRDEPLIDLRFFGSAPFSSSVIAALIAFAAMGGFLLLNTLYLQDVRGLSPLQAGLMTLPMAGAMAICAPLSGRIVASRGARLPMMIAGVATTLSGLMLVAMSDTTSFWYLGFAYAVLGVGAGLVNAPITNAAVSGMPKEQAGVASGVASVSRQVGTSLGVAVFGAIAFAQVDESATDDLRTGLADASHPAWMLMAVLGVALVVVGYASTGEWAQRTVERTRAKFL